MDDKPQRNTTEGHATGEINYVNNTPEGHQASTCKHTVYQLCISEH